MKNGKVRFDGDSRRLQDAASHGEIHERFRHPALIIKKIVQKAISLPSNLCLDAPMVAVGWAALISIEVNGIFPPLYIIGGLFFAVWGIYLFDRIFDSFRLPLIDGTPQRHVFAKKRRFVLFALSGIAVSAVAVFILPHVTVGLLKAAFTPGILCLVYFVTFRFTRQGGGLRFPVKEVMIGVCFSGGVLAGVEIRYMEASNILLGLALALIFAGNCLIIGRAERAFDQVVDAAAFFGQHEKRSVIPVFFLSGSLIFGVVLAVLFSLPFTGGALIIGSFLQLVCRMQIEKEWMQPLADGALLFPWLMLFFFG